jgi:hypothetical protein
MFGLLTCIYSCSKRLLQKGPDYKCYYNQVFLRGLPDLTCLMVRLSDAGKRLPDRQSEPNLYAMITLPETPLVSGIDDSTSAMQEFATSANAESFKQQMHIQKLDQRSTNADSDSERSLLSMPSIAAEQCKTVHVLRCLHPMRICCMGQCSY